MQVAVLLDYNGKYIVLGIARTDEVFPTIDRAR
jgi:hypothetical protein